MPGLLLPALTRAHGYYSTGFSPQDPRPSGPPTPSPHFPNGFDGQLADRSRIPAPRRSPPDGRRGDAGLPTRRRLHRHPPHPSRWPTQRRRTPKPTPPPPPSAAPPWSPTRRRRSTNPTPPSPPSAASLLTLDAATPLPHPDAASTSIISDSGPAAPIRLQGAAHPRFAAADSAHPTLAASTSSSDYLMGAMLHPKTV